MVQGNGGIGSPLYSGGSLGEIIISSVSRYADRIAFVHDGREIGYGEVGDAIGRVLAWFERNGIRKGDTVAQLCRNRPEQWFVMAAAYIHGLRSVTLHSMGGAEDHLYVIDDSEAKAVLFDKHFASRVAEYRSRCPGVALWQCHESDGASIGLWDELKSIAPAPLVNAAGPEDIVRLAYTGGTTGRPKGVMLSNRALVMNTMLTLVEKDWPEDVKVLCTAQISHGAGAMVIPTLSRGGTFYLYPGFDKDLVISEVARHKITVAYMVPTMIYAMLDHPPAWEADWSSLRLITYGASPISPAKIKEAMSLFGPVLCQGYGQTEAPNSIAVLRKADHDLAHPERFSSCGKPYPGITVAVLDDDCNQVATGKVGEICVRGQIVMSGYWKQPELTAEAFKGDWLHTGDVGYQDAEGYLYIVDRKKDMIISGGFNVYPKEIEDVLHELEEISSAAVIGVPDEKWGEAVKAVVVMRKGRQLTSEKILEYVRAKKGPINTPKTVDFVEALPVTAVGKPDKKALRAKYWDGQTRAVN